MTSTGIPSRGRIARWGYDDPVRALGLLQEIHGHLGEAPDPRGLEPLAAAVGRTNDPDQALAGLARLLDRAHERGAAGPVLDAVRRPDGGCPRVLAVLGASTTLTDHLMRHPEHVRDVCDARLRDAEELAGRLRDAVAVDVGGGAQPDEAAGADALRVAYNRELIQIAALDLTSPDPAALLPEVTRALADLAAAALRAALDVARRHQAGAEDVRLSIVAMGKCGGRELNYISDVDVVFVTDESEAVAAATRLASTVMRLCSAATAEGSLWPVDAALRPEGKRGPLVRTLDSYVEYYERWAKTWEFQALLKARPVAGDADLATAWSERVAPMVWAASSRESFVDDVHRMRRMVEEHIPADEVPRQIKLGPGGLRDVEFTVQLLQLVHGSSDPTLRSATTLEALAALRDGGYVGRDDAAELDHAYRTLRLIEHRVQLPRLRRSHLVPTGEADLRRLGRAMGLRSDPGEQVLREFRTCRTRVRRLHERIFYRPLLAAVARLSADEVRLGPDAARARMTALGFRDAAGALRHLESLTSGVSRRATIQRHLLPAMLGWFASGADPDAGLLAFRRISESLGTIHWYLKMLRDEGTAAERLAQVLSSSRYATDLLVKAPESVALFGDPAGLRRPLEAAEVQLRMRAATSRQREPAAALTAARGVRAHELLRVVIADLVGEIDPRTVRRALSDLADALIDTALQVATQAVLRDRDEAPATRMLVVGMGRLGGRELSYASDVDVLFVHDPLPVPDGVTEADHTGRAAAQADAIAQLVRKLLAGAGPDPVLGLDAGLRPEGRSGPLVRSLEGYSAYYARWSAGWEAQALIRARVVAGDPDLGEAFLALIAPLRWPPQGLSEDAVREIRLLKARMESERLPRGADPRTHLKLGYGGLSDVEWVAQLLQLQHAHGVSGLRTTSTVGALEAAVREDLITRSDADLLGDAWELASRLRDAGVLWRGRTVDGPPSDPRDAEGIAGILGSFRSGSPQDRDASAAGPELEEDWRRTARRARRVVERLLYGGPVPGGGGAPRSAR